MWTGKNSVMKYLLSYCHENVCLGIVFNVGFAHSFRFGELFVSSSLRNLEVGVPSCRVSLMGSLQLQNVFL